MASQKLFIRRTPHITRSRPNKPC